MVRSQVGNPNLATLLSILLETCNLIVLLNTSATLPPFLQKKKTGSPSPFLSSAFTVSHLSDKTRWAPCVCSPGSFRLVMKAVTSQINLALTALFSF